MKNPRKKMPTMESQPSKTWVRLATSFNFDQCFTAHQNIGFVKWRKLGTDYIRITRQWPPKCSCKKWVKIKASTSYSGPKGFSAKSKTSQQAMKAYPTYIHVNPRGCCFKANNKYSKSQRKEPIHQFIMRRTYSMPGRWHSLTQMRHLPSGAAVS